MVGEPTEQCPSHLGVSKDGGPLTEAEIGGDSDAGAFVELAEQMKQQCATGSTERLV